jgi:hypothetical protein
VNVQGDNYGIGALQTARQLADEAIAKLLPGNGCTSGAILMLLLDKPILGLFPYSNRPPNLRAQ